VVRLGIAGKAVEGIAVGCERKDFGAKVDDRRKSGIKTLIALRNDGNVRDKRFHPVEDGPSRRCAVNDEEAVRPLSFSTFEIPWPF
jgi:hypothetical protein